MKRFMILSVLALMMLVLVVGCGKKAEEATDKAPVENKAADMVDSAKGMIDSTMDAAADSLKEAAEEVMDEAAEKVKGM